MKLLTKDMRKRIPELYSQENNPDPMVQAKFFDPSGSWTWYVTECSPVDVNGAIIPQGSEDEADVLFFGLVDGFVAELGYFTLSELQSARGQFGLGIERDMYFNPRPLSEIRAEIRSVR